MYNNEVTYDKKWDTQENKDYQERALSLIGPKSTCRCDVPAAWSKEVYHLLNFIENRYGIEYDLNTYYGYYVSRNWLELLIKNPFMALTHNKNRIPEHLKNNLKERGIKYTENNILTTVKKNIRKAFYELKHSLKIISRELKGMHYNISRKPKVKVAQVKEKFGTLRIYYSAAPEIEEVINFHIMSTEISLAQKGAYYDLDSMYEWSSSSYEGNKVIKTFPYREFIDIIKRRG